MADDGFTKRKFAWLDQIAHDRGCSAEAFRLAYILASDHLNRGTGDAWPSQEVLAQKLGVQTPRAVKHLVDQLVRAGHLEVTFGRGRGHSNRYAPLLRSTSSDGPVTFDLGQEKRAAAPPSADAFEDWWLQYPRKVSKGHARQAYERVVRSDKATAEELLTGAMRYAAERHGQDPKFTKHPATWLNGEGWKDETARPNPPTGGGARQSISGPPGPVSALAGIFDWLNGPSSGELDDELQEHDA